ncbi:hypothetical protein Rumi1_02750 [[Ruminococcus] torques]|nr:hypothetical protein Rumi1_02750 [[Ruminococcus] torques]
MAIRVIREIGDDILEKQCKAVPKMTLCTKILIGDMLETMYESNGVGLAAPQVGVLKRIVVIDVGEGLDCFDQSADHRIFRRTDRRRRMSKRTGKIRNRYKTGPCKSAGV